MTWGELSTLSGARFASAETSPRYLRRLGRASAKPVPTADGSAATCEFDARHQQVLDFSLPDLRGRPVRFKNLDADLVLLDFWGSWCNPCLQTIPHLIELQKRNTPGRLKVIGIAYEQGPAAERIAAVEAAARKLGINYQLLLGDSEGPCPLQGALHVQAYPTMILLDRQGHILWRDQGSAAGRLARLDRVVAAQAKAVVARR